MTCQCQHRRRAARSFDAWDEGDAFTSLGFESEGFESDGFDAYDDTDGFLRILRVLPTGRTAPSGFPALRTGGAMRHNDALRQLLRSRAGVFLQGASAGDANSWANRLANARGGRVVHDAPHGPGARPHFHIELPGGRRTGHIFYGPTPPPGDFFEDSAY
ncbi:hypothetical protein [Lysobacter hankyongensis]|uniref:Uncharacterized protein n=1 Tax=Lysobacter hankyongensis TaxID=1176535 RepID=A0ABP9BG72_9GAMM